MGEDLNKPSNVKPVVAPAPGITGAVFMLVPQLRISGVAGPNGGIAVSVAARPLR